MGLTYAQRWMLMRKGEIPPHGPGESFEDDLRRWWLQFKWWLYARRRLLRAVAEL